jgi:excisionase family DNA binding protein
MGSGYWAGSKAVSAEALSTIEAARRCGVHYTTIRRWVLDGNLPAYETPGGHLRILKEDMDAFIESRKLRGRGVLNGTVRVLVVDDERAFLESVVEFLAKDPRLVVREAADGFTAGRLVAEFQPDVVILDLMMPGLNGFDTCREIRSSRRSRYSRILVLTGYPSDENIRRAMDSGADLCVAKPIELDELLNQVLRLSGVPARLAH